MKILLLSDTTPCDNYTAGLVLSAMVRLVPRDQICIFSVLNPSLDMRLGDEFTNIPIEIHPKPNENWSWLPRRRFARILSAGLTFAAEKFTEGVVVPNLVRQAIRFGRDQKVDRVWAVLQGQTTIRMAEAVAKGLGVPLHTHVWDPFSWWAQAHGIDRFNTRRIQCLFDKAIAASHGVATASAPMADLYRQQFGVSAVPVIASHHKSMALSPEATLSQDKHIVIGMAGQFYAAKEWLELLKALRASGWVISGRQVRVVVVGPQQPPGTPDPNVSFLGWKSQRDAALIMAQCDVLYCPYPFDTNMKEVSSYSFPSKLVLYLLAGRPIVFHGPEYSAPAKYIRDRRCGLLAGRLHATNIYNELERLLSNADIYRQMAVNAQEAFVSDFTLESMDQAFNSFIGGASSSIGSAARLHDHRVHGETIASTSGLTEAQRRLSLPRIGRHLRGVVLPAAGGDARNIRVIARKLLLKIPRLNSLYTEIHALYAENALLASRVVALEAENSELKIPSEIKQSEADRLEVLRAELNSLIGHNLSIVPGSIACIYPNTKMLVLVESSRAQSPSERKSARNMRVRIGSALVMYSLISSELKSDLDWTDNWDTISSNLQSDWLAENLHAMLAHGIERVIVEGSSPSCVAHAAELARLASCRLSVVSKSAEGFGWLIGNSNVDYISELVPAA